MGEVYPSASKALTTKSVLVGRDVDAVLRVLAVSGLLRGAALLAGGIRRVRLAGAGGDDDVGPDVVVARRDVAVVTPEF